MHHRLPNLRIAATLVVLLLASAGCTRLPVSETRSLMGTQVSITIQDFDRDKLDGDQLTAAMHEAFLEIDRIEQLAKWDELAGLNAFAGADDYPIGDELIGLIDHAYLLAQETDGTFRPDMGPLLNLWRFGTEDARLPPHWQIEEGLAILDSTRFTVTDSGRARLDPTGAVLDLGGIAKGYAVDRACERLKEVGVTAAMVWAGGDLKVFGEKPDGEPWRIAVRHPRDPETFSAVLELVDDVAVATSGDYERFFEVEGARYHHILDPATGYSARKSVSATVVAPSCMDADAYATAFFVLGPDEGRFMAELIDLPAMIISEDGGELRVEQTPSFSRLRSRGEREVLQP